MLCSISENISGWSVTYSGAPVAHPLATASPTSPPPAPSSNLYSQGAVAPGVSWGSSTSQGRPHRATGDRGRVGARAIRARPPGRCRVAARHPGAQLSQPWVTLLFPCSSLRSRCSLCYRMRSHPTFLSHVCRSARGGVQDPIQEQNKQLEQPKIDTLTREETNQLTSSPSPVLSCGTSTCASRAPCPPATSGRHTPR